MDYLVYFAGVTRSTNDGKRYPVSWRHAKIQSFSGFDIKRLPHKLPLSVVMA